jgi:hypothetical protein
MDTAWTVLEAALRVGAAVSPVMQWSCDGTPAIAFCFAAGAKTSARADPASTAAIKSQRVKPHPAAGQEMTPFHKMMCPFQALRLRVVTDVSQASGVAIVIVSAAASFGRKIPAWTQACRTGIGHR